MNNVDHVYTAPARVSASTLPEAVQDYLNGDNLAAKTQALRISTVDKDGWPHAGLLSAGDMLAHPPGHIRFMVFAQSTMTANLARDGRVTVILAMDNGMCELRMTCRRLEHAADDMPLALFEATLLETRHHKAIYASITAGITFGLHHPDKVLPRWHKQIEAMRHAV